MKSDVYQTITDKIVAMLEQGVRPWMKPWSAENAASRISRPMRSTGQPYRGINVLLLWAEAVDRGYGNPFWFTYKQTQSLGAQVRKGEKSATVVYADIIIRQDLDGGEDKIIPYMKLYSVINGEQVDNLPAHFNAVAQAVRDPVEQIQLVDAFTAATGADIRHDGNQAYYNVSQDFVQMPPLEALRDAESYYATETHELVHWTRHKSRLDRDMGRKRWGDAGYAAEELVAEQGAAYLCADLGIVPEVREDHAGYIAHWLQVMKGDKRAIFTAASHAERAVEYLHGLQPGMER